MKKEKIYNDIIGSIFLLILWLICLSCFILLLYFGVIHAKEGTNRIATLLADILLFGSSIIILTIMIIKFSFSIIKINEESIELKKKFHKKIKINLNEVEVVKKETMIQISSGAYKDDCFSIYSINKNEVIKVLINKKNIIIIEKYLRDKLDDLDFTIK